MAGFMAFGVIWGFTRILLARSEKTPLSIFLSLSIVVAYVLLISRSLYVAFIDDLGDTLGTAFNLLLGAGALFGLHAQYLMVPAAKRATGRWHLFNAWTYPPRGISMRIAEATLRISRLWRGDPSDIPPENQRRRWDDPDD